jgi:hypothetical protein
LGLGRNIRSLEGVAIFTTSSSGELQVLSMSLIFPRSPISIDTLETMYRGRSGLKSIRQLGFLKDFIHQLFTTPSSWILRTTLFALAKYSVALLAKLFEWIKSEIRTSFFALSNL